MTELKNDYKEFAEAVIEALKTGDLDKVLEMPETVPDEDAHVAIKAVLEAFDAQDDKFKEDNAAMKVILEESYKVAVEANSNTVESSEAATEDEAATEAVSEKAVEPAPSSEDLENK